MMNTNSCALRLSFLVFFYPDSFSGSEDQLFNNESRNFLMLESGFHLIYLQHGDSR